MILTDDDIIKQMSRGRIEIEPFTRDNLGSNSYDLTLGGTLLIYTDKILDCKKKNSTKALVIPEDGLLLKPGELYLGHTVEFTSCRGLIPCIEGKSSVARLGISVHLTAGFGDVGFSGSWTLEITVVKSITVYKNMPIAQLYWTLPLGKCRVPYNMKKTAKYNNQSAYPVSSLMHLNSF